jgi:hypothetical protein
MNHHKDSHTAYHTPARDEIARTAYELWENAGRPENTALDHWLAAEKTLLSPASVKEELQPAVPAVPRSPGSPEEEPADESTTVTSNRGRRLAPASRAGTRVQNP